MILAKPLKPASWTIAAERPLWASMMKSRFLLVMSCFNWVVLRSVAKPKCRKGFLRFCIWIWIFYVFGYYFLNIGKFKVEIYRGIRKKINIFIKLRSFNFFHLMSQTKKTSDKNRNPTSVPKNEEKHKPEDSSPPKDEKKTKGIIFVSFIFWNGINCSANSSLIWNSGGLWV